MKSFLVKITGRKTRMYMYTVSMAVCGYLVYKGIVKSEELFYLNGIMVAVFGVALANVPTKDTLDPPPSSAADKATKP